MAIYSTGGTFDRSNEHMRDVVDTETPKPTTCEIFIKIVGSAQISGKSIIGSNTTSIGNIQYILKKRSKRFQILQKHVW